MSNHYRLPGRPPCRCAVCWPKPARDAWRQVQRAMLNNARRRMYAERTNEQALELTIRHAERTHALIERINEQARELAEWLAQDVH